MKPNGREDSLHAPIADGDYSGHVAESSVYTKASVHPLIAGSLIAGLGFAAFAAWRFIATNSDAHSKVLLDRAR